MRKIILTILLNVIGYSNSAIIDLTNQKIIIKDNENRVILKAPISSGNKYHLTPKGVFHILEKEKHHRSNLYPIHKDGSRGGAKMDYMLKFTHQGNAIHQGDVVFEGDTSIPISHGCVRVTPLDAREIFNLLNIGDKVVVVGHTPIGDNFNTHLAKNGNKDDYFIQDFSDNGIYDDTIGDDSLNITFKGEF